MIIISNRLFCRHMGRLESSNLAVYLTNADGNAIIKLKNINDFISTKPFVIFSINMQESVLRIVDFLGDDYPVLNYKFCNKLPVNILQMILMSCWKRGI